MKKILFIIPYVPYPLNSGGNQAFYNMVEYIRHKMSVSLLLYPNSTEAARGVQALKELWTNVDFYVYTHCFDKTKVKHPLYYKWLGKAQASITRKMRRQLLAEKRKELGEDMARERSTLFSSAVQLDSDYCRFVQQVAGKGFDVIQVEFYELVSLGYWLPDDVQTVFVHHELRYIRNEREMTFFKAVTEEDRVCFRRAKGFELAALSSYKHLIALTEVDRLLLSDFIKRKEHIYASPAVVQIDDFSRRTVVPTSYRLTFVGSEHHYPNLDGVAWFCNEVAPCLRSRNFRFKLQVVGVWEGKYVDGLMQSCPEMELAGYVEDLHAYLNGSIMIVPIRIGSGMRMKILDGVSAKAPFVTTTKGVEGIDLQAEEDYLQGDTAQDFASSIIRLAGDAELQRCLAEHAADRLLKLYDPQVMLKRRLNIYEQILDCRL